MKILTVPEHTSKLREPGEKLDLKQIYADPDKKIEFEDKLEQMKALLAVDGLGLAATQVGWGVQLFMLCVDEELNPAPVSIYVNPEITQYGNAKEKDTEGCLSFPKLALKIKRPRAIKWKYQTLDGDWVEAKHSGYYARALQHEIDHLNGKLFADRASAVEGLKYKKWLKQRMV